MPEKRYKRQERRVAKIMGAQRNPHDGSGKPDVESEWLVVENKDRAKLPKWILETVYQARRKAGPKRLGVATLTSIESPDILVVMLIKDFKDWYGWTKPAKGEQ